MQWRYMFKIRVRRSETTKKGSNIYKNNHIAAVHANVFFYSAVVFGSRHLGFHSRIVT